MTDGKGRGEMDNNIAGGRFEKKKVFREGRTYRELIKNIYTYPHEKIIIQTERTSQLALPL